MIDRVAWDREHNPHRPHAEEGDQVKYSTLPPGRPTAAATAAINRFPARSKAALRPRRAANLSPSMRPRVIAATTGAKMAPRIAIVISAANTNGDNRAPCNRDRAGREGNDAHHDKATLGPRCVDQGSHGSVHRDPDQAADCQDQADCRLVPPCLREQEYADIRPQPASHIGQQEVQPIQRHMMGHAHSLTGTHGLGTPITDMG